MTERKKRRGCAGVTFSEHERQRSKRSLIARSDLWPVLRGDWALHCPWVTPSVPLLYCSSSVPRFLGYFKAWSCSSGAVPLFKQSSTSDSYMAGEWLGGEGGGDCLTDAQQGFVSGPLWSYWLTDTCRVAKSDLCVCECVWRATSHRSWWVLSEGVTTKRDKCFVCYLVHSQLWPLLFPTPGLQQLFDTLPWHFFDEREWKDTSCGCLVLHSQVDDSPPWCSITWMFCLPLGPVDSHNTVFCSHRLRPDSSVVFLRESK